jgi:hypothetical protein
LFPPCLLKHFVLLYTRSAPFSNFDIPSSVSCPALHLSRRIHGRE